MKFTEISAADFNLAMTLNSGQVFHWEKAGKGFVGTIGDWAVCTEQRGEVLCARVASASSRSLGRDAQDAHATIFDYFALDHPLAEICASFPDDPVMNAARQFCRGLRIIRQPKWECLATFICSSMKQVAHIRQISLALRRRFGERRRVSDHVVHTFPPARRIARATEDDLRECALGYRAKNLLATARLVTSGECDLESWSALSDPDLREKLCSLPGVGAKIANCVMLFAYERLRAFPIDVWIERVLKQQYFPRKKKVTELQLRAFSETYFGEHGGYAQQYLFHHARMASRTSEAPRDSSTPKAFGARNDKGRDARMALRRRPCV
ncbi:MAG TPA: DNA glycosylase [Candidatus Udaeobacter sp.]|nr:DNA glycosylase [Candidatus Udaeobacter sp.]